MEDVSSTIRSARTGEAGAGRIRTCRPAFRELDVEQSPETGGQERDPEPQIVRGED
ncbi:hypothetical protein AB0M38_29830 [Streptomyces sp. NPDC051742]|uniref:hypothetical protein n=1 Tax=unclassified Streptomyces TaxID=2593676 RepID=UPI00341ABABC